MPIQENNIVFVESQVMDDVPEGGGAATGRVIIDGQMNNVFEDISDLDRALGRFNLRKIFVAVRTLDTDLFGGAKTVVTMLPEDDAIGYTLFQTGNPFDTRAEAANLVQAYLFKGPMWHGVLWENHIAGMQTINLIQRVGTELPPIGKTLCLVQFEGQANEIEQYVRVINVDVTERTFTDSSGDFQRWQVTLTLSDALRSNYTGHTPNRFDSYDFVTRVRVRDTSVADAARYYAAQPITEAVGVGDTKVRAASMFASLVPSARTETPLVNRPLASGIIPMVPTRETPITYTATGAVTGPGLRLVLRGPAYPGSVTVTVGAVTFADNGAGRVIRSGDDIGAIDYATGEIQFAGNAPAASGSANISYRPAVAIPQQSQTRSLVVTPENRRLNYIETLLPIPAPGVLEIAYRAQGNWYALRSDINGAVSGTDPQHGAGTVSHVTGVVSVTLGALPDVGSQVIYTWATPVHYAQRAFADIEFSGWTHQTEHLSIEPGSVTITWEVDSELQTVTDDGAGNLTGDGTGRINYALGQVFLMPDSLPEPNATPQIVYDSGGLIAENFSPTVDGNGFIEVTVSGAPIEPGSVVIEWETIRDKTTSERVVS